MFKAIFKEAEEKMKKTVSVYNQDLQSVRAGRANAALLDKIVINYYGQATPLNQVGTISTPEPRLLVIQPWDVNLLPIIEKEILKSDLGLNPSSDGKLIRLAIPALTEQRRKELVRFVKKNGEDAKVAIRNTRRDLNEQLKKLEKDKGFSEDDIKQAEQDAQKLTDKYIMKIDDITERKEEELMEV